MSSIKEQVAAIDEIYAEVLAKDGLNDELIITEDGTFRWKEDPITRWMVDQIDLTDLLSAHFKRGGTKNDLNIRQLYRNMGYSLFGYWEVFFWDVNNSLAGEWEGEAK